MKINPLILLAVLGSATAINAAQVWFSTSIGGGHVTSTGAPLKGDTIVELGAFTPGFVPTPANTAEWKANWQSAARSIYDEQNGWYSGAYTVTSNTGAFATSQQGWIWVFNRSGEWCLYSKPSWTWPSNAGDNLEAPVQWSVDQNSISVVGTASANPQDNEITTALVSNAASPSVTFEQWAALIFGTNPATFDGDNDGDGISNFAEYAFGSRADMAGSVPGNASMTYEQNGQKYLAVGVTKGWATGVIYGAELSSDLNNWDNSAASVAIVQDNAAGFIARDSMPIGARDKAFMRLSAKR